MIRNTFAETFRPENNSLGLLRLVFALFVLMKHAYFLGGFGDTPLEGSGFPTDAGQFGVACFFVLSGALVTSSWDRSRDALRFLRQRFLRIMPGYWGCLVLTALVLGPVAWGVEGHGSLSDYFKSSPTPAGFIGKNAALLQGQSDLARLFAHNHQPFSVNGSLWTLKWEFLCYLGVLGLGMTGLMMRFRWLTGLIAAVALINVVAWPPGSIFGLYYLSERDVLLPIWFFTGATFYLFRSYIPRSAVLGVACWMLLWVGGRAVGWAIVSALFLPYAIFWLGSLPLARGFGERVDLSYGIYIYSFPVQQILVSAGLPRFGIWAFALVSLAATAALAGLSWFFVERPALRLKVRTQAGFRSAVATGV